MNVFALFTGLLKPFFALLLFRSNLICKCLLYGGVFKGDMTKKLKTFHRPINFCLFPQRFKFCGDADCPDYILAIIHSNLCGLSSIKLKVFASNVIKVILTEQPIDEQQFADAFGDIDDSKSAYLCLRFLLLLAVRFDIGKDVFSIELQQLGLPREHSLALGKVLDENSPSLKEHLKSKSLTINELAGFDFFCKEFDGIDCVTLWMQIKNSISGVGTFNKEININNSDIPNLIKELKIIQSKMDQIFNNNK